MDWDDNKYTAMDFETSGVLPEYALQPWRIPRGDAWGTSLVWVQRRDKQLLVGGGPTPDELREHNGGICVGKKLVARFIEEMLDTRQTLVGWNLAFDISVLMAYGFEKECFQLKYLDGLLLCRHLEVEPEYEIARHKKKSFGLKLMVAEKWPEHGNYEDDVDYHSIDINERIKLYEYNVRDNVFALRLTRDRWLRMTEEQQRCAMFEAQSLPLVAQCNLRGMKIDPLAAKELSAKLLRVANEQLEKLEDYGVTEKIVRSPTQLARLMFDVWGLPVLKENESKVTGKTSRSTDKEVLHELSFMDERVKELRTYREALNNRTKFAETPVKSLAYHGDGFVHPMANVFGTYSGRLTYSSKQKARHVNPLTGKERDVQLPLGFALHQMKRGKEFRSIVVPPDGYDLVEFDAAGQEFRWMAVASGDETMLSLCAPGEDAHSFMGAQIREWDYREFQRQLKAGVTIYKDARQLGKVGNLSLQYRTSARKLRVVARVDYDMAMTMPEAVHIRAVYLRTYKGVPLYWNRQITETKLSGYVETFAGRRVQVVGDWDGSFGWSMGSTAINYRIQGTGADQKYLALAVIRSYLVKIGAYFAFDLHDGIYLYVPKDKTKRALSDIKKMLDNLPYEQAWGFSPPIDLPWDAKHGPAWGMLEEWKGE